MSASRMIIGLRWILPAVVFLVLLGTTVIWWAETSTGSLPILSELPDFEMVAHTGQTFDRQDLNGKISVVSFIFTNCRSICPTTCMHMSALYRTFAASDKVQFLSISVDPDRDTIEALRDYARSWGIADSRWLFLRAPIKEVVDLSENGFMLPADNLPMGHTVRFTLIDDQGRIRAYYDGMDPGSIDILKDHIRLLAREMQ